MIAFAGLRCVGGDDSVALDGGQDTSTQDTFVADVPVDTAPEADPCATAPTKDFYVNATTGSDSNNGAGPTCAFKTITAALTASEDATAHANATLHLAAGTYGSGETFPLVVDHGRSLVGAGAATTKIQGSSTAYVTNNTGSIFDNTSVQFFVTLIAGDNIGGANGLAAATISNVTILPASTVTTPTTGYIGVACTAGNGPNVGTTPPLPSANLVLQSVTVGPNFDVAFSIGSAPSLQTACNAKVLTSSFVGSNVGITTGACGTVNPSNSWPSAQIGDGQVADANTFTGTGIGVFGNGCGSVQSINTNKFVSGYRGTVLVSQPAQYFEVLGNTFDGTTSPFMGMGLQTNAGASIAKLNDNTFANISESAAADTAVGGTTGYGVALGGGSVAQAQRNEIHDNDNGVQVSGKPATFDFSSDGSSVNRNQIYCNSKTLSGNGYDVVLTFSSATALNFTGNQWDHATPTTSVSLTTSANGTDVVTGTSGGATTTNAGAAVTTACAAGRVR